MTVKYTTVSGASSGFGMWQADPGWITFGTEYGLYEEDDPCVTEAKLSDWTDWLRDHWGVVETDTEETRAIDGNVYDQHPGAIFIARESLTAPFDEDASQVYCAYEED
jgi:hypothetical protein